MRFDVEDLTLVKRLSSSLSLGKRSSLSAFLRRRSDFTLASQLETPLHIFDLDLRDTRNSGYIAALGI